MKRVKWLQLFFITLLLASIGLFFYPIVGNIIANQARSVAIGRYDKSVKEMNEKQIAIEIQRAKAYNQYLFASQEGTATGKKEDYQTILNNEGVIGTLDIPAIDIKHMPIFHGATPKTLENGLGHMSNTSVPIGGIDSRSVITGHSGVKNQILFSDVNLLQKGDIFYLTVLQQKMAYQVFDIRRVYPQEVEAVAIEPGKDLATLLTCDPPGINTYRLLVTGKRVELDEANKKPVAKRNTWDYQHKVFLGTALVVILTVIWLMWKRGKKRREKNA